MVTRTPSELNMAEARSHDSKAAHEAELDAPLPAAAAVEDAFPVLSTTRAILLVGTLTLAMMLNVSAESTDLHFARTETPREDGRSG